MHFYFLFICKKNQYHPLSRNYCVSVAGTIRVLYFFEPFSRSVRGYACSGLRVAERRINQYWTDCLRMQLGILTIDPLAAPRAH